MNPEVLAHVGLGGNLGEVADTFARAAGALGALPDTRWLGMSRLYRTPAWGVRDQPDFLNAVCALRTRLDAGALMAALLEIEICCGRTRAVDGSDRWGPRTLDLDLLLFGDARIAQPGLQVPHPRLHTRAFALVPLLDIAPDAVIPGIGRADAALAALDADGIEALT